MCVNNLSKVALDSASAGIWTRDLQSQVQRLNHYATEPHKSRKVISIVFLVVRVAKWTYYILKLWSTVLIVRVTDTGCGGGHYVAGSDAFLDSVVHCYLSELLRIYCRPIHLDRMDFGQPVPGLASFHDLWVLPTLLDDFRSVSGGYVANNYGIEICRKISIC